MILSDSSIRKALDPLGSGTIKIDPYPEDHCFQPASVDLHLADEVSLPLFIERVDPTLLQKKLTAKRHIYKSGFDLLINDFILGSTVERITLGSGVVARVEGCSSLGRLGLMIHSTAGFIDPGFSGDITLEIKNIAPWSIKLTPGMRIAQIAFEHLDHPAQRPYGSDGLGSRYQNQTGPTASR